MTKSIPDGWHSVTPRLVVHDALMLVAFLKQAFDATGDLRIDRPSVIKIGDSLVMVSSEGPRDAMTAFLYLYVDDIDATYRRALEAGAVSLEEPWDTPYGDRPRDGPGSMWQHLANGNPENLNHSIPRRNHRDSQAKPSDQEHTTCVGRTERVDNRAVASSFRQCANYFRL